MRFQNVLCPIDFSEFSTAAYRYASSVAEHYNAHLTALHVIELWKYPYADYGASECDFAAFEQSLLEGGCTRLRDFLKQHSRKGVERKAMVEQGNAADLILSFARQHNVELIVMGTHGRRGLDRLVLGSTTDRVMRRACCPVLVVSNESHNLLTTGPDGRHRLSRILYCTDFSHDSARALDYAISVTEEHDAELTVLHVASATRDATKWPAMVESCSGQLEALVPKSRCQGLRVQRLVKVGKAYQEIVRHATETRTSLIIMTARGGDAVDRAVFGSTTYRVIQLGPCAVLAVHT